MVLPKPLVSWNSNIRPPAPLTACAQCCSKVTGCSQTATPLNQCLAIAFAIMVLPAWKSSTKPTAPNCMCTTLYQHFKVVRSISLTSCQASTTANVGPAGWQLELSACSCPHCWLMTQQHHTFSPTSPVPPPPTASRMCILNGNSQRRYMEQCLSWPGTPKEYDK